MNSVPYPSTWFKSMAQSRAGDKILQLCMQKSSKWFSARPQTFRSEVLDRDIYSVCIWGSLDVFFFFPTTEV